MPTRMKLVNSIVINAPIETVFDYISDISKDPNWRNEVDKMEVDGSIEVGTLATEYSTLFRPFVKTVTPTRIKVLDRPNVVAFETDPGVDPWLVSHRSLKALRLDRTEVTYRLETDLPPSGTFGKLYLALMTRLYGPRLPRYLLTLKKKIESSQLSAD
ncbi:SRPBCC family protein [Aliiroseovarius sp. 2305UL8-7]|uniref:SRPBCC family protein n=1 Tax=Aliiroseovarius conchicola TaxID=3121637 RepID=UPI00352825D3